MKSLCAVVLNYRTAKLTVDCVRSAAEEIAPFPDRTLVVVDNASGDGSAEAIESAIASNGWSGWARLVRAPRNGGFSAGNNVGFRSVEAGAYLLLNSDTWLRPGSVSRLLETLDREPRVGLLAPRLEWPDGTPQESCFRYRSPVSELIEAAGSGPVTRLLRRAVVALPVSDSPIEPAWVSFASVLIRRAVIEAIGPMDEGYFMYFEDIDYCRRARAAGFTVRYEPSARVVHLRGGSSPVKAAIASRTRVPRYYYEARSRYFAKFYGGRLGLAATNACWLLGRSIAWTRETFGSKPPGACLHEARDNWTNFLDPYRAPSLAPGSDR